jgi:hypothetical protein
MSAFRGILTGFGMAAIKDKEAKDNMRMKITEAAGIDFYKTDVPEHEKEMKLYETDFKNVSEIYGVDIANYFGTKTGIFGTGKALNDVSSILDKYDLDKEQLKNMDLSTFDERKKQRTLDFDKKKKVINEMSGLIGPYTLENQFSDVPDTATQTTDTATQTTDTTTQTTDTTTQTTDTKDTGQKVNQDIGTLFTKKPDVQGVETKFNSISKAVNEQMQYGSPIYNAADGTTTFNIADELRTTSNAHIRIASVMTQNDNNINQLDAVSRSKQELDNQTVTPFNIISSSVGANYIAGNAKQPALITGGKGGSIDVNTVIKAPNFEGTIRQFLENVYANVLLDDGQGNTDSAVFAKFLENIPDNLVINAGTKDEQKYKEVIASSHALKNYYKNY